MPGGRPRKYPGDAKSVPISFRISEELRKSLEMSRLAEKPPLSLSQEIESRLLGSFGEAQRIEDSLGGRTTAALLLIAAAQIRAEEISTGKRWWEDRYTYDNCLGIITGLFENRMPKGKRKLPPDDVIGHSPGGEMRRRNYLMTPETRIQIAETYLADAFYEGAPARPEFKKLANALVPKFTKKGSRHAQ